MTFASRDVSQGFLDEAIARLRTTGGVAVDQDGYVYIGDQVNNRVRVVTPSGMMHTVAGTGVEGYTGDGGPAECAQMSNPDMIVFDHEGHLYVPDYSNAVVRKLTRIVTT